MQPEKAAILAQLQKDILPLQGFKQPANSAVIDVGLGPINDAFPNASFPTGAVHEFLSAAPEHTAATAGFICGLLNSLTSHGGACIWISPSRMIFPPALKLFGIQPDQMIFVDLKKERDLLWAFEEALGCEGLTAVIGEIKDISFTASRRLQLAVEKSRVTGFVLRPQPCSLHNIASVSRWRITPAPGDTQESMPGVGFPRWNIDLLKMRNGKPGHWQMEWGQGRFRPIRERVFIMPVKEIRKTV